MILQSLVGEVTIPVEDIAEITIGFVPADLHALVRRAKALSASNTLSLDVNLRKAMESVGASVSKQLCKTLSF
jgi:SpoVK/Ycf46/Vps4 family AAA+-type ATPase